MSTIKQSNSIHTSSIALGVFTVSLVMSQWVYAGEWRLGGELIGGRNPYVGEDNAVAAIPAIGYKDDWFYANLGNPGIGFYNGFSDLGGLGLTLAKNEHYNIDLVGKIRLMGLDPDDNDELEGLDKRKPGFDAGLNFSARNELGEINLLLLTDISDHSNGQEVVVGYAYPVKLGDWSLKPEVGVSWLSEKMADYYFGVDDHETASGRDAYEAEATLVPFAGIQAEYAVTDHVLLIGGGGIGRLGDGIGDSPIVENSNLAGGYAGVVYRF